MSAAEDYKLPLTVVTNREKTKVLFADVDSDFVDILLSFTTLPLGKILRLFKEHYGDEAPVIGSLSTLYKSLADLDDAYFCTEEGKKMLLNPRSIFSDDCRNLEINLDDSQPTKYFYCGTGCGSDPRTIAIYNIGNGKCTCGQFLDMEIPVEEPNTVPTEGVFTRTNTQDFALGDDMQLRANVSGSMVENLRFFGVTDVDGAESRTVHVGGNEIMDLLRGLLFSQTPLTDLFINEKRRSHSDVTFKYDIPLHIAPNTLSSNKINVKITFQKSTDKLLFAQADEHFVDFLFSMLVIPLGAVAYLLNGSTHLGSVDYLHRSIGFLDSMHFKAKEIKTRFLEPVLPCMYLSDDQILPISDQIIKLYYNGARATNRYLSSHKKTNMLNVTIEDPKGDGFYVRRPAMFIVTDDLVVTPLSASLFVHHLNMMKVGLSDIKEVEVEIGVEEALKILKASLTSSGVLTKALNRVPEKKPKEENVDYW